MKEKVCTNCNQLLPIDDFYLKSSYIKKNGDESIRHSYICRCCTVIVNIKYKEKRRENNNEKIGRTSRKGLKNNKFISIEGYRSPYDIDTYNFVKNMIDRDWQVYGRLRTLRIMSELLEHWYGIETRITKYNSIESIELLYQLMIKDLENWYDRINNEIEENKN